MFYPARVFTPDQEATIVAAIRAFERRTRGEMRVHVEHRLRRPPLDEAKIVFSALEMHHTQERNGVLILLAPAQRSFAVFGDVGIDAVVEPGFWEGVRDRMREHLASGDYVAGIVRGIEAVGEALVEYFPWREGDVNELPDDISYG